MLKSQQDSYIWNDKLTAVLTLWVLNIHMMILRLGFKS